MISFDGEGARFNYRVAAVIIEDGRVLLSRAEWEDFWYLPGGRVEMGETAHDSLGRELREELGVHVDIGRLVWVLENFFEFDGTAFHEIGLYFEVSLPEATDDLCAEFERADHDGRRLLFRWVPVGELESVRILPEFLVSGLRDIPNETAHVVHRDDEPFERA